METIGISLRFRVAFSNWTIVRVIGSIGLSIAMPSMVEENLGWKDRVWGFRV